MLNQKGNGSIRGRNWRTSGKMQEIGTKKRSNENRGSKRWRSDWADISECALRPLWALDLHQGLKEANNGTKATKHNECKCWAIQSSVEEET